MGLDTMRYYYDQIHRSQTILADWKFNRSTVVNASSFDGSLQQQRGNLLVPRSLPSPARRQGRGYSQRSGLVVLHRQGLVVLS